MKVSDMGVNKDRILFLWHDKKDFYARQARKRGVQVDSFYLNNSRFFKRIVRYHQRLHLPFFRLFLRKWAYTLNTCDVIIVHANSMSPPVVRYLTRRVPSKRLIVWYWNPVAKSEPIDRFGHGCEVWSFDPQDAKEYKLRSNTQYHFNDLSLPAFPESQKALFVGRDKGRLDELMALKSWLADWQIESHFHITESRATKNTVVDDSNGVYQRFLPYEDILALIAQHKVIIDVVSENQTGLTLRPLEALFFEKKLLTNDPGIADYDFYCAENIFIIGQDDPHRLASFMETPYKKMDRKKVDHYDFDAWLARFFQTPPEGVAQPADQGKTPIECGESHER